MKKAVKRPRIEDLLQDEPIICLRAEDYMVIDSANHEGFLDILGRDIVGSQSRFF